MPNAMVIDLSHHNAVADFARVRAAGVAGVIHKATQGTGFVDKMYMPRKQPALDAGLLWGAYHFGTADDVDDQVEHFIDTVQPDGSFALVLDFEKNEPEPGNSMSLDQAKAFLTSVEARTGQRPRLYTSGAYMTATAGAAGDPDLAKYHVWWAQYANAPKLHATWSDFWLWQFSDGIHGPDQHSVDGVGNCDCNTFNGDEDELRASWLAA
jgi:lysozyme